MKSLIKITCKNNNVTKGYPLGKNLAEIAEDLKIKLKYPILGARVNNRLEELSYEIYKPKIVEFIDFTNIDGFRMYQRSLSFVLMKSVRDLLPDVNLKIEHSISHGFYCELEGENFTLNQQIVCDLADRMREIVNADIPFRREELPTTEAIKIFERNKFEEKARLFKSRPRLYTSVYYLDSFADYFYGYLVPSTGYLKYFDLVPYYDGLLLRFPSIAHPEELGEVIDQSKLFDVFRENKSWCEILGLNTIGNVNEAVEKGIASELIKISEALHEKKIGQIADRIINKGSVKLVLVAGPSSSGKTTFSKRLCVQLTVGGLKPIQISMDNYFVDRDKTPKDEKGEYDFESVDALDLNLFNQNLADLIDGKEIEIPKFSFQTGSRYYDGEKMQIGKEAIIIIEGIHCLNPRLSQTISENLKFKIYVSALTAIGIDWHNRIPTTDNRLLRRIIRDNRYRGYTALDTLKRWASVRRGEEKNIFPFQELADVMFNSALLFELGVIKNHAEPLLKEVNETEREYSEARRLLKFLSYFNTIQEEEIPPTSILREFLTGSSFKY